MVSSSDLRASNSSIFFHFFFSESSASFRSAHNLFSRWISDIKVFKLALNPAASLSLAQTSNYMNGKKCNITSAVTYKPENQTQIRNFDIFIDKYVRNFEGEDTSRIIWTWFIDKRHERSDIQEHELTWLYIREMYHIILIYSLSTLHSFVPSSLFP